MPSRLPDRDSEERAAKKVAGTLRVPATFFHAKVIGLHLVVQGRKWRGCQPINETALKGISIDHTAYNGILPVHLTVNQSPDDTRYCQ
jgi:hypothetical protein